MSRFLISAGGHETFSVRVEQILSHCTKNDTCTNIARSAKLLHHVSITCGAANNIMLPEVSSSRGAEILCKHVVDKERFARRVVAPETGHYPGTVNGPTLPAVFSITALC